MKTILTILCLTFSFSYANAQATWTYVEVNDSNNNSFNGVCFTSETTGVIVGQNGMIKRSTDGGKTWTIINSGQTTDLNNVFFLNQNLGWAVGTAGIVIKTTDGGLTWANSSGTNLSGYILKDVKFLDANNGYVTGSQIFKTIDGGNTWTQLTSKQSFKQSIDFIDINNGYVCGNDGLLGNTVNGTSFLGQTSPVGNNIYKIRFINDSVGVAVGQSNLILYTKNKGVTWTVKSTAGNSDLLDICTIGKSIFWAVGTNGYIQKSTDAGNSWTTIIPRFQGQEYKDISFINENLGWFVGESGLNIYDNRPKTTIKKIAVQSQIQIYPNPSNGFITLNSNIEFVKIEIRNTLGQLLNQIQIKNNNIDMSMLNNGIYFIQATDAKGNIYANKIIKE